mgnify:CR=1 FL=1
MFCVLSVLVVIVVVYTYGYVLCCITKVAIVILFIVFFQAEDGIRDLVRSRGLGDVYKRQI